MKARAAAARRNIGWRLNDFLISRALRPRRVRAALLKDVIGSDYCPVVTEVE